MNIRELINLFKTDPFWQFYCYETLEPAQLALRKKKYQAAFTLPEDYLEIFSFTDGFVLRRGDHRIYHVDGVLEIKKPGNGFSSNALEIGLSQDFVLLIDLEKVNTSEYLFVGPTCVVEGFFSVGTITDFLNALVENHGDIPEWMATGMGPFSFRED